MGGADSVTILVCSGCVIFFIDRAALSLSPRPRDCASSFLSVGRVLELCLLLLAEIGRDSSEVLQGLCLRGTFWCKDGDSIWDCFFGEMGFEADEKGLARQTGLAFTLDWLVQRAWDSQAIILLYIRELVEWDILHHAFFVSHSP